MNRHSLNILDPQNEICLYDVNKDVLMEILILLSDYISITIKVVRNRKQRFIFFIYNV